MLTLSSESSAVCDGRRGGTEARGSGLQRGDVERDAVVGQEVHDLGRVAGLFHRLVAEQLGPAGQALAIEVGRDRHVQLVGPQLVADLLDQQLGHSVTDHGSRILGGNDCRPAWNLAQRRVRDLHGPGASRSRMTHAFLANDSYWAAGVPRDVFERSIDGSIVFGVYRGEEQVGFARVVSDRATLRGSATSSSATSFAAAASGSG